MIFTNQSKLYVIHFQKEDNMGRIVIIASILLLMGCNTNDVIQPQQNQLKQPPKDEFHDQLGFVHHRKDDINDELENNRILSFNREEMANIITRIILKNEGFDEVATLVTDKEVLIAFASNENIEKEKAEEIAEKVAASILPRFFKIYASANESLIHDIHSLHNSRTTRKDYDNTIKNIIEFMEK